MPTLNWIGKDKVVNQHQDVPYRVFQHKYGFTAIHIDGNQNLNEQVAIEKIREYIWFSETRTSFVEPKTEQESKHFLGKKDQSIYYFIYEKDSLTTLDFGALEQIKTKGEQYIIYADNCLLPKDFMAKKNIILKKIPRDITRF